MSNAVHADYPCSRINGVEHPIIANPYAPSLNILSTQFLDTRRERISSKDTYLSINATDNLPREGC